MAKFRDVKTLQKFGSVHASIHNHFNHERHLNRREIFNGKFSSSTVQLLSRNGANWLPDCVDRRSIGDEFALH